MIRPADASRRGAVALGVALALLAVPLPGQAQPYTHFTWHEVKPGVWLGVSPPNSFISGNSVIVALPGGGTLVVDPHITQSVAGEIIAKARQVGGEVKILVNTHLHNDHTQGNVAFTRAFPDVQIYAHKATCDGIVAKAMPRQQARLARLPAQLEEIRRNAASVQDATVRAGLEHVIQGNELYLNDYKTHAWALPNRCLPLKPGETVMLATGERPVMLGYYGRAHTAGDLVVFLERERVLINGDLWGGSGVFDGGRDGSGVEFSATLRRIAALDFDTVLPGHGGAIAGKAALEKGIADTEAVVRQVKEGRARGEYLEQLIERLAASRPAPATPAGGLSRYVPYMSAPAGAAWTRNVTRVFEELELREQLGLPIP